MKLKSEESPLKSKSYEFSIKIIKLAQCLHDKREYVLSRQVLRSGTAIGALIREAEFGESRADFRHKMNISLKEANETNYWLSLLKDTNYMDLDQYENLSSKCNELVSMLVATVKTLKK